VVPRYNNQKEILMATIKATAARIVTHRRDTNYSLVLTLAEPIEGSRFGTVKVDDEYVEDFNVHEIWVTLFADNLDDLLAAKAIMARCKSSEEPVSVTLDTAVKEERTFFNMPASDGAATLDAAIERAQSAE